LRSLSSLRRTAPLIFLNVSLGDGATPERRQCGCPMEAHSWTPRLRDVRSFGALTPGDAAHQRLLAQAQQTMGEIAQSRWMLIEEARRRTAHRPAGGAHLLTRHPLRELRPLCLAERDDRRRPLRERVRDGGPSSSSWS